VPAPKQKPRQQRNRPPSIESFTSSVRAIPICQFSSLLPKPEVELLVNATDPDGDSLSYQYSVAEGTISGKGKSVRWDLKDLPRGLHEARVTVTDDKGGKVDASVMVVTFDSGSCDAPPPPCPSITINGTVKKNP